MKSWFVGSAIQVWPLIVSVSDACAPKIVVKVPLDAVMLVLSSPSFIRRGSRNSNCHGLKTETDANVGQHII